MPNSNARFEAAVNAYNARVSPAERNNRAIFSVGSVSFDAATGHTVISPSGDHFAEMAAVVDEQIAWDQKHVKVDGREG